MDIAISGIREDGGEKSDMDAVFGVWMGRTNPECGQFESYCLTLNNSLGVGKRAQQVQCLLRIVHFALQSRRHGLESVLAFSCLAMPKVSSTRHSWTIPVSRRQVLAAPVMESESAVPIQRPPLSTLLRPFCQPAAGRPDAAVAPRIPNRPGRDWQRECGGVSDQDNYNVGSFFAEQD